MPSGACNSVRQGGLEFTMACLSQQSPEVKPCMVGQVEED